MKKWIAALIGIHVVLAPASAQEVTDTTGEPELCRTTGLLALKQRDGSLNDVSLDMDSLTIAKANTKVGDTPVRTIIIGDAYLQKDKKDTRRTFLCLVGEKSKVLLTFFTEK
jgi:hypothetical protein